MISLILYGRNDNHGYNLHKRAAISLNAMAEVLSDPDDEILFVDYNTPDDLPTFIEAIGDTLTPKARACLRILRVRPVLHERFKPHTHLLALEPVARNVALRRSNPRNRWVLSTNTDMIFVPHKTGASLSHIASGLADDFYQLPRFELPESLWESFDRRDGVGIIDQTRAWATRFHLNEIVYGSDAVLYDGPGDFQLCLRADLFRIHGFHEKMLRGWHVDANLCARMIALRGQIKSLASELYAYHCDHTRQLTTLHGHDRVENDADVFTSVKWGPTIPGQADTWGLAGEDIEEIRLGVSDIFVQYRLALEAAVSEPQREVYESAYRTETFGGLTYRRKHVLPFVLDLLVAYPAGAAIAYIGGRVDTCADLAAASASKSVAVPEEFSWLHGVEGVERRPLAALLEQADLFVFEFGAGEPDEPQVEDCEARLGAVRRALLAVADMERTRARRRRILAINAIHNEYEALVGGLLAFTLTPFSSHVRHGYVRAEETQAPDAGMDVRSVWREIGDQLGRTRSVPLWETQELVSLVRAGVDALHKPTLPSEVAACAEPLIALLRHRHAEAVTGVDLRSAHALTDRLELERPGLLVRRRLRQHSSAPYRDPALKSLSRVADIADWEKPAFARFVDRHLGSARAYGFPDRNPWTWERAAVLDILAEANLLNAAARVLLVSTGPDAFSPILADYVANMNLARARGGGARFFTPVQQDEPDPRGFDRAFVGNPPDDFPASAYDAVIFLQQSLMRRGPRGVAAALAEAAELLKPGGLIIATIGVSLAGAASVTEFKAAPLIDGRFGEALNRAGCGLEFCGPLEATLTPSTCDRVVEHARKDLRYRRMVELRGNGVAGEGVLTFRRLPGAACPLSVETLSQVIAVGLESELLTQVARVKRLGLRATRLARRGYDMYQRRWRRS